MKLKGEKVEEEVVAVVVVVVSITAVVVVVVVVVVVAAAAVVEAATEVAEINHFQPMVGSRPRRLAGLKAFQPQP
jgi:hypothetical protein